VFAGRVARIKVAAVALTVAALTVTTAGSSSAADPVPPPLPRSMAAVGDSITRGFHLNWLFALLEAPQYSWSTGSWPGTASHASRIVAAEPRLAGHVFNDAVNGARMSDLQRQLTVAASQHAEYVTVLLGANDVCQDTLAALTPTSTFSAQFTRGLDAFFAANPDAHVLVASIPNLQRLWSQLHGSLIARTVWTVLRICPAMLGPGVNQAQRDQVLSRIMDDNAALEAGCARYPNCRFDGYATFRYPFTASQISTVDYFHPNLAGQNALASLTWAAGYWPAR
jgi:lysophospholipase L1-like esterase